MAGEYQLLKRIDRGLLIYHLYFITDCIIGDGEYINGLAISADFGNAPFTDAFQPKNFALDIIAGYNFVCLNLDHGMGSNFSLELKALGSKVSGWYQTNNFFATNNIIAPYLIPLNSLKQFIGVVRIDPFAGFGWVLNISADIDLSGIKIYHGSEIVLKTRMQ